MVADGEYSLCCGWICRRFDGGENLRRLKKLSADADKHSNQNEDGEVGDERYLLLEIPLFAEEMPERSLSSLMLTDFWPVTLSTDFIICHSPELGEAEAVVESGGSAPPPPHPSNDIAAMARTTIRAKTVCTRNPPPPQPPHFATLT